MFASIPQLFPYFHLFKHSTNHLPTNSLTEQQLQEIMEDSLRNCRKLMTLWVNVVRWDTNQQWRRALVDFVPEEIQEQYSDFEPEEYVWSAFEEWIEHRLKYSWLDHVVVLAQYGVRDPRAREVLNAHAWQDILRTVAGNEVVVPDNTDLYFLIAPRKCPKPPAPNTLLSVLNQSFAANFPGRTISGTVKPLAEGSEDDNNMNNRFDIMCTLSTHNADDDNFEASRFKFSSPFTAVYRTDIEAEEYSGDENTTYEATVAHSVRIVHGEGEVGCEEVHNYKSTPAPVVTRTLPYKTGQKLPAASKPSRPGLTSSRPAVRSSTTAKPKPSTRGDTAAGDVTTPQKARPSLSSSRSTTGFQSHIRTTAARHTGQSLSKPTPCPSPSTSRKPSSSTSARTTAPRHTKSASLATRAPTPSRKLERISPLTTQPSTTSSTNPDYGAPTVHLTVDTYLGSYNASASSPTAWHACLDFFNLPLPTASTTTAPQPSGKRVPLKKLPGMSVGLFDYQLMGVFNLLRFLLQDVSGGLLCDEQGLGKTQEMFGVVALAWGLRRCKAEVKAAWRRAKEGRTAGVGRHNRPGETRTSARVCPFDGRYGFRCYCYCEETRQLADRLPEGGNVLVAPARGCAALAREAKVKLDGKVFKIRGVHEGGEKEDQLTVADVEALRATVKGTQGKDGVVYEYQAGAGQSDYIIVVSPEFVPRLNGQFGVEVRVAAEKAKKSALLPGIILLDEFHEYAVDGQDSRVVTWLQRLKNICLSSQQPTPLAYFVSGTPFGETPADIRPAIELLERLVWQDESHPLKGATLTAFDDLVSTFDTLTAVQAGGDLVPQPVIASYRRQLDLVLNHTMVRRLGTGHFQGRNLTDIGPLKVNITDHQLPNSMVGGLQSLAKDTHGLAVQAAAAQNISLSRLLRSKTGEALLLKLRLASAFPALAACPSAASFTFTPSELHAHLNTAKNDVSKTPYFSYVPTWSASSPKLVTLTQTLVTMLTDKTPIPGSASSAKKACLFSPIEAESVLLYSYLLLLKAQSPPTSPLRALKPVLLHSNLPASTRHQLITQFLAEGNASPNVLVAPLALAGTGLNLQRARYSVVTGPAWTRRENQQAYYRIHRVGQRMETRLGLLTARWNPAERIVLEGYEGRGVEESEGLWDVGNRFCEEERVEGLVERHQRGVVKGGV